MDHVHQELVGRNLDAALPGRTDDGAADGIHLRLPALGQVRANRGDAVRHPFGGRPDLLQQVRLIRLKAQGVRDRDRFMQKLAGQREGVGILGDEAHPAIQDRRDRAEGDVDKQLVPDQLLDVLVELRPEAAPVQRVLQPRQHPAGVRRQHAQIGSARAAVADVGHSEDRALVLGGADDDVVLIDEFPEDILVPRAVLQRQQVGVLPDQAAVPCEGRAGEQGLYEQYDQVHLAQPGGVRHGLGTIDVVLSVFLQADPLLVDRPDDLGIGIHKVDFIVQRQVTAIDRTHGARANHRNFHAPLPFLLGCQTFR